MELQNIYIHYDIATVVCNVRVNGRKKTETVRVTNEEKK